MGFASAEPHIAVSPVDQPGLVRSLFHTLPFDFSHYSLQTFALPAEFGLQSEHLVHIYAH